VNRRAQAVVLLLFGGAIVKARVTDLYLRYVKEGLRPFLIGPGCCWSRRRSVRACSRAVH
jgi:hypothetical protein